jgi:hypothetical protein
VRFAKQQAEENGWVLVQDTAWEGYETIPTYIMQGYLTMAAEAVQQLGGKKPTHIFLQAGVGAMSGALAAFFRDIYGFEPQIIIVEPDKADCFYHTAKADDGNIHTVGGALDTIMAGLACGEPCTIGWDLLKFCADAFISMEDTVAAKGRGFGLYSVAVFVGNHAVDLTAVRLLVHGHFVGCLCDGGLGEALLASILYIPLIGKAVTLGNHRAGNFVAGERIAVSRLLCDHNGSGEAQSNGVRYCLVSPMVGNDTVDLTVDGLLAHGNCVFIAVNRGQIELTLADIY